MGAPVTKINWREALLESLVVADHDLLAGGEAAAAVHRRDLDPLVVLQARRHVQPLGMVALALEDEWAVVPDENA